jgi:hypothetical protein
MENWQEFAVMSGGASAALTGLLFVAEACTGWSQP